MLNKVFDKARFAWALFREAPYMWQATGWVLFGVTLVSVLNECG